MLKILLLIAFLFCPAMAVATPNIVFILADDFSINLMPSRRDNLDRSMPNLARMIRKGMTFDNYFVSNSLCCPSRAATFMGKLPHNTGVLTNIEPDGGLFAFNAYHDELYTFAVALEQNGYNTAFMGKYLNGYNPKKTPKPPGWDTWLATDNGYKGFGYTANFNGKIVEPAEHFTDYISQMGGDFIKSAKQPFFIEYAPFSPHAPYVPPARYNDYFLSATYPKTSAYDAKVDLSAPAWLQEIPKLTGLSKGKMTNGYIHRLQSAKGIDDLIGEVLAQLSELGIQDNTYVVFTSDNGYHMGEMSMRAGKMTPFDFDIKVPFVVIGPGIIKGSRSDAIAMNIDLYSTFLDIAGLASPADIDGRSLLPVLLGGKSSSRVMAVIEHTKPKYDPADPDAVEPSAGNPPTYTALRFPTKMYVEYETGEKGYYDLSSDPDEMHNIVTRLTQSQLDALHAVVINNATCSGQIQCAAAQDNRN